MASVAGGRDADLVELATRDDVDLVVVATGGVVSLRPVLAALAAGKVVATANKETLVAGGHLVMPAARAWRTVPRRPTRGTRSPARSPGSARSTRSTRPVAPGRGIDGRGRGLVLTASGGPFLDASPDELAAVTPERALRHPTWTMGAKITIDSATSSTRAWRSSRRTGCTMSTTTRSRWSSIPERRPFRRPLRRRFPQGPVGYP